jgi:hypothetical protein
MLSFLEFSDEPYIVLKLEIFLISYVIFCCLRKPVIMELGKSSEHEVFQTYI